jgi:hypothetical protein
MAAPLLGLDVASYKKFLAANAPALFAGSHPMCCSFADFFEKQHNMMANPDHFAEFPESARPGDGYRCSYGIDGDMN